MPINPNSLSGSADKLTLAFAPSNSTPTIEGHTDATNQLSAILNGVDDKILHSEPYDVVGGRLDWVSTSSIRWSFLNSNQIRLYNPTSAQWELVKCSAEPQLLNTTNDLNGTALAPNTIYDVFAEYDSSTAFDLVLSRWATGGDGANNSSTSYATPVMTANNAPGPVVVSADSEVVSKYAWKALNQTVADSSDDWCSSNTPLPHWLKIDMGVPVCINRYAMRAYNYENNNPDFFPANFTLSGSNDDSTYTTLDTRTGISFPGTAAWTSYFNFLNSQAYRYYKLNVTAITGGSNYVVIGELKLVAASNSLAGSSSRVRAYESTVTYNIGDRVTYDGHDWVKQSSAAAGTTPVAGNDWVDNGTSVSGDFAGLYRHNGVLVSDSSTTGKGRRWLGIIYTYNNSGTVNFKDDVNYRYVSNWYNRKMSVVESTNSNAYWTYQSNTWREFYGGSGQIRGNFIVCESSLVDIGGSCAVYTQANSGYVYASCNLNSASITPPVASAVCIVGGAGILGTHFSYSVTAPAGLNWITEMEKGDGSNQNRIYGTQSGSDSSRSASTILG